MFGNLLESRARPQFRLGGSLASVTAHAMIVGGAVVLTANAQLVAAPTMTERIEPLVSVPTPMAPAAEPRTSSGAVVERAAKGLPSIVAPDIVPIDIPSIELRAVAPLSDDIIASTRRGQANGVRGAANAAIGVGLLSDQPFSADQVDKPVILRPGSPYPAYPEALRQAGITGMVTAQFVVDTTGRVIAGTVHIARSDHDRFAGSVRAELPRMRFLPAEYQGRKVSQLVELPFRFDITP